ncbi:MAG: sodium/proline symporter [Spirochaetia bacterium]|nr:sodium/proline symporter [Spirochaetia bacterium]MBQ3647435.1 sodium/proline symporter [Spirochaetia bacterium]MBQ6904637.1 sodium/proline symporter [Spirochaetia bacterium]
MNYAEVAVFTLYLIFMISIGVYFFLKNKSGGDKTYFLGGRKMGAWVSALSAGASDMSAWVLMGLPASVYALGTGQAWIAVGLAIGYALSWIYMAPRLRTFSIECNDSITIPQYLTNRFLSKSMALQIICAIIFIFAYTIYAASSIKACGTLFNTVIGIDAKVAMYIAAAIIISYTFLGGFAAVCWTDFFQGMLMLGALLIAPIFALFMLQGHPVAPMPAGYLNPVASWQEIISGLAWGLGYFGMPHIIIRFMAVESQASLKKSAKIGITWNVLIVIFAVVVGIVGRMFLGYDEEINKNSLVFITMVRKIFPGLISGILLSAILAAAMSTADSQLLSAASAFASDVYKPVIRKGQAGDKEMLWGGRIIVLIIALAAVSIASNPNSGSIMSLVSNAWGVFGASFGPAILLSLFWKRLTFSGAVAGILAGSIVDIYWMYNLASTGIYELFPGFVAGLIFAVVASVISKEPEKEVLDLFDRALNSKK